MIKIALFAYNRPKHFESTLFDLLNNCTFQINIYIDGPSNKNDEIKQGEINRIIEKVIDKSYKNRISIKRRKKNHGLANSILKGIQDSFKECDKLIIIEDDIRTTKNFFKFIEFWLDKAYKDPEILSVCGYQFPFNEEFTDKYINTYKMPRFVPWGWATRKKKWDNFYMNDLEKLKIDNKEIIDSFSLPEDIQKYIRGNSFDIENSDTWSIPWTLSHYFNNMKSLFPSYSLLENNGFDGSGIHCGKTKIFDNIKKDKVFINPVINELKIRNLKKETATEDFLISKSYLTMTKAKELKEVHNNIENVEQNIKDLNHVKRIIYGKIKYVDFHSHLFPQCHKKFHKSGFIELLNYHYFLPEIFEKIPNLNLKKTKKYIANQVWNKLFLEEIPLSTSAKGLIKILDKMGIHNKKISFEELVNLENELKYDEHDIFAKCNIKSVVMTNNPFNIDEWSLFKNTKWDREMYKSSIRLDYLFSLKDLNKLSEFKDHLDKCIKESKPEYLSISLSNDGLKRLIKSKVFLNYLSNLDLPLWIMIGVKRKLNPKLDDAGDCIDLIDLELIRDLISNWQSIKFIISNIHYRDEHYLNTLSRNFQNISLAGTWWYMNNKSYSKSAIKSRIEMLGTGHKLFFSDSRVLEQLIYKTSNFQDILTDILLDILKEHKQHNYQFTTKQLENSLYTLLNF